jgi:hypothetical protein
MQVRMEVCCQEERLKVISRYFIIQVLKISELDHSPHSLDDLLSAYGKYISFLINILYYHFHYKKRK